VLSRYGWIFVNPYMTLVTAYERLIGERGQEIKEEPAPVMDPSAAAPVLPDPAAQAQASAPVATGPISLARPVLQFCRATMVLESARS
jgi:hypothetical protein